MNGCQKRPVACQPRAAMFNASEFAPADKPTLMLRRHRAQALGILAACFAAQASDCGCRTLAIARYPGPWIVRTGGKACEAPVSCFGRGLTGIFLRASREQNPNPMDSRYVLRTG